MSSVKNTLAKNRGYRNPSATKSPLCPYPEIKKEPDSLLVAVTARIIKGYGGDITVESALGKGTTFHAYLPVIKDLEAKELEELEEAPKGRGRILFVDDEKLLVEVTSIELLLQEKLS